MANVAVDMPVNTSQALTLCYLSFPCSQPLLPSPTSLSIQSKVCRDLVSEVCTQDGAHGYLTMHFVNNHGNIPHHAEER